MKILKNPKTVNYYDLKDFVLGEQFPWYINECVVNYIYLVKTIFVFEI